MDWYYCEKCKEMRKVCSHKINEVVYSSDNSSPTRIKYIRKLLSNIEKPIRLEIDID